MDKDEIKGKLNRAKGSVKEKVGEVTGDRDLEAEGSAEKLGGNVQEAFGAAKRKVRDTVDDITEDK
jgi:uncharacterized protein YjbJ (UPF0337 family)